MGLSNIYWVHIFPLKCVKIVGQKIYFIILHTRLKVDINLKE